MSKLVTKELFQNLNSSKAKLFLELKDNSIRRILKIKSMSRLKRLPVKMIQLAKNIIKLLFKLKAIILINNHTMSQVKTPNKINHRIKIRILMSFTKIFSRL
jgi:hypothetical protein